MKVLLDSAGFALSRWTMTRTGSNRWAYWYHTWCVYIVGCQNRSRAGQPHVTTADPGETTSWPTEESKSPYPASKNYLCQASCSWVTTTVRPVWTITGLRYFEWLSWIQPHSLKPSCSDNSASIFPQLLFITTTSVLILISLNHLATEK